MFNGGTGGTTGLQDALENEKTEIAKLFIQYGASLKIRNSNGHTALEQTSQLIVDKESPMMKIFKNIIHLESN